MTTGVVRKGSCRGVARTLLSSAALLFLSTCQQEAAFCLVGELEMELGERLGSTCPFDDWPTEPILEVSGPHAERSSREPHDSCEPTRFSFRNLRDGIEEIELSASLIVDNLPADSGDLAAVGSALRLTMEGCPLRVETRLLMNEQFSRNFSGFDSVLAAQQTQDVFSVKFAYSAFSNTQGQCDELFPVTEFPERNKLSCGATRKVRLQKQ